MAGSRSAHGIAGALLTAALLAGTSACAAFNSGAQAGGSSSSTRTATHTATPTAAPSSSATIDDSATSASGSRTGGPLGTDAQGRKLTLNDFFNPSSYWQERRYDIADQKQVQGIGAQVSSCGDTATPQELELRLANNFSTLRFSVAQANDSVKSDQSLSVEVLANNRQAESRSVPFNQVQQFTIDVRSVNALKIDLRLDSSVPRCGGSVIGVVTGATVN